MTTKKTPQATTKNLQKKTETDKIYKDYADYLKSPEWQKLRKQALIRDYNTCVLCKEKIATAVHHHKYSKNWNNDSIENLMSLCGDCHNKVHNIKIDYDILHTEVGYYSKIKCIIKKSVMPKNNCYPINISLSTEKGETIFFDDIDLGFKKLLENILVILKSIDEKNGDE